MGVRMGVQMPPHRSGRCTWSSVVLASHTRTWKGKTRWENGKGYLEQDPLKGVCGIQPLYSLLARKVAIIKCQKYQNEHQWMLPSLIQIIKQVWKILCYNSRRFTSDTNMYTNGWIWIYYVSFFLDVDVVWTCELVQVLAPTNSRSHNCGTMSPTWHGCDESTHPTKANVHCPIPWWALSNHQTFHWSNHEGENKGKHKLYSPWAHCCHDWLS